MTAAEALERANALGAQVRLEGDRLILHGQANMPEELLEELRIHREEVIALLAAETPTPVEESIGERAARSSGYTARLGKTEPQPKLRSDADTRAAKEIEVRLQEAFEIIEARGREANDKIQESLERAFEIIEERGSITVESKLNEALDALAAREAETLEAKLTDALEMVRTSGAETVEAKLKEVIEQACVTVETRGAKLVDDRLNEAVDALAARDAGTLEAKLTDAIEAVNRRGAETVEARLTGALKTVNRRGAETVEARLTGALETLNSRIAEMVEAKLTEVVEQARVTVERRGAEFVDERLKDAVDALAARDAETVDLKLMDALENVRARGAETVEARLKDAFERALSALSTQDSKKPESPGQGPRIGESSSQERREPMLNTGRGLRSALGKPRAEEPKAEAPVDVPQSEDLPAARPNQAEGPNPEQAAPPNQERAGRQLEGRKRGNLWRAAPPAAPSQQSTKESIRAEASAGPRGETAVVDATGKPLSKDAPDGATATGRGGAVPGKAPAAARAEAASRSSRGSTPSGRPSTSPQARAVARQSPAGRIPIGTSMVLTAGAAASLAFGWAAGEVALIWTSVGSGMGAALFLAMGHHSIAGKGRHSASQPESKPSVKPLPRPTPAGPSGHGRQEDPQTP
jgi:hypothetical protein